MPFSLSGTYSVLIDFSTEAGSPPIPIADLDAQMADLATALSNCILRDGTGVPTAAIAFGSQDVTAMNTLTISNALADTNTLTLDKAGSKIALARSSDGALSFVIGSATVGGVSLSIKNTGGGTSEIQLGGSTMNLATAALNRIVIGATGLITMLGTTAATTPTLTVGSDIAIAAGGAHSTGIGFSSTAKFGVYCGSGVPTITVAKGSLYLRSDGSSSSTRVYVASDGAGTWVAVTTAS